MKNRDLSAIITALGGRKALQDLLGVGPSAVSNYLARGSLPQRALGPVCEAVRARGYHIDPASLQITGQHGLAPSGGGRRVLLIVGGGIAAYKALEVARRLQDHMITVTGVMTGGAQQFITPLSLSALTGEKAYTDLFSLTDEAEMGHIRLARETDLVLVVPATANLMARAAHGMADDLATTILLATTAPVMMAPAMNQAMWGHPATQENLARLRARGILTVGPDDGGMACGEEGTGRLSDPQEIVAAVLGQLSLADGPLSGRHALVTSGPTVEPIDPVRFIANRSSGKQGHAIAAALAGRGARVTLVSGPVTVPPPPSVELVEVETARQMLAACEAALPADIAVCAAAVADWHVADAGQAKMKKQDGAPPPQLALAENPDILKTLSSHAKRPQLVVGFAAETESLHENAAAKLARKGCDWIVANQVAGEDGEAVFGSDSNAAILLTGNDIETWPRMPKIDLAARLAARIGDHFA
ncbi:MAG: bifunctional phosphopantothenoylcysteine decarboxylase/phosphopantothenate--cysteine ligase CoaBC [Candidatus Puniceispirillaceae bacterium]